MTNVKTRVTKNGIVFLTKQFNFRGVEAYFDDDGKIRTRSASTDESSHLDDFLGIHLEKGNRVNKKKVIIFDIILIIFSIIGFAFNKNFFLILAAMYFCVFVSSNFLNILKISYDMKVKKENKVTAKLHAAEHMLLNAYEKLQRVPTLEEAKKFSRFYKNCKSAKFFSFRFMIPSIFSVAIVIAEYNPLIAVMIELLSLVLFSSATFLQVLVTSKPSDKELKLAIEGLKQFEEMEEQFAKENLQILLINNLTL